jgi:hypothetical protein
MSYGTCCSASHTIACRASSADSLFIVIFFHPMTARPETAATTLRDLMPRDSIRFEMASVTS